MHLVYKTLTTQRHNQDFFSSSTLIPQGSEKWCVVQHSHKKQAWWKSLSGSVVEHNIDLNSRCFTGGKRAKEGVVQEHFEDFSMT